MRVYLHEGLAAGHYEQVKLRLLTIGQEQIFRYGAAQYTVSLVQLLHAGGTVVVDAGEGDAQLVQQIIAAFFYLNAAALATTL